MPWIRNNPLPEAGLLAKCCLEACLSFFYPEVCQHCGREHATADEGYIGAQCRTHVKFIQPPFCERCGLPYEGDLDRSFVCSNCHDLDLHFRQARSAVVAQGMVLDLIHDYKYHRALWLEPFLARLLVNQAAPLLSAQSWDMIVPVPLHPSKLAQREFNQAERLARHLSRATGLPLAAHALRRIRDTHTQTHLNRADRQSNMRQSFVCPRSEPVQGRRCIVLDDVFTTGATTNACAGALQEAGTAEICIWTLARGLIR